MRLLQVCNVGNIVGGTAACAWTVAQSLPWAEHTVAFLSPISGATRAAFRFAKLVRLDRVASDAIRRLAPHVVLLHNTPRHRADASLPAATIQCLHSRIAPAPADITVYCSQWLAEQCGHPEGRVLHQAVPIPPRAHPGGAHPGCSSGQPGCCSNRGCGNSAPAKRVPSPDARLLQHPGCPKLQPGCFLADARALRTRPIIGRLCTPQARKWPAELVGFYRALAEAAPHVDWEFVGCPPSLHALFRRACRDRATFHEPGWSARSHLWRWDALLYHHPALTESFGRTCAEAMRAGCLPIVDNRGGFREQIARAAVPITCVECLRPADRRASSESTPTGWLCDSFDDFASAVAQLQNSEIRWAMSRAARAHADERFSLHRFADDLIALVREVHATTRCPTTPPTRVHLV